MNKDNILEVNDLHVDIRMQEGLLTAVRGVTFEMKKGELLTVFSETAATLVLDDAATLSCWVNV